MQPQNVNPHQRIKWEPTIKQKQIRCRLFGKDFDSVAAASRYYRISYSWAKEMVHAGRNQETWPRQIHPTKGKWRDRIGEEWHYEVADTDTANEG